MEEQHSADIFRWIADILNVPSANLNLFPWTISTGHLFSPTTRVSISDTSIQSHPCCPFVFMYEALCTLNKQTLLLCPLGLKIIKQMWPYFILSPSTKGTCWIVILIRSSMARSLWEAMLTSKYKEAVMEVRRHLVEAASKEKLPVKMSMGKSNTIKYMSYSTLSFK